MFPKEQPKNLAVLKQSLRQQGQASRGLLGGDEGKRVESEVRRVAFNLDPQPFMSATITYYRPEK